MKTHELKCWPEAFGPTSEGTKLFEFRKNDRDYEVGDTLHLREWEPIHPREAGEYTGRELFVEVTHILNGPAFGVASGYCIMGIKIKGGDTPDLRRLSLHSQVRMVNLAGYSVDIERAGPEFVGYHWLARECMSGRVIALTQSRAEAVAAVLEKMDE